MLDADKSAQTAYIALGSNLGDRAAYLQSALDALRKNAAIQIVATSSYYETAPQDVVDQPWFLNQVTCIQTCLNPTELLFFLQKIESSLGRLRAEEVRRGPRTVDLDILLFSDLSCEEESLTIPHPRMVNRRFVLEPLLEIAPNLIHPQTSLPFTQYLRFVLDQPIRRL